MDATESHTKRSLTASRLAVPHRPDVSQRFADQPRGVFRELEKAMSRPLTASKSSNGITGAIRIWASDHDRAVAPRMHRVGNVAELLAQIRPGSEVSVRRVGQGILLRSPNGQLSLLSGEAAAIWNRLDQGPCVFLSLLDLMCHQFALSDVEADARLRRILQELDGQRAIDGAAELTNRQVDPHSSMDHVLGESAPGVRRLGRLELMEGSPPQSRPNLGHSPIIRDVVAPPRDVAIVCQYGIVGLAEGIESYGQRCVRCLKTLNPDLIVLSGGGRHGLADVREAESVIERYLDHFPGTALWVEKHSGTSWANVQHSLELLMARSMVPERVFLIGDRARTEKLRLSVWLARRRFPAFRSVSFHIMPELRQRVTWRDWRVTQLAVGWIPVLRESRTAGTALSTDHA